MPLTDFAGPFSFPFLGYYGQGRLINKLLHKEFEILGAEYGNLIFFKLFMDQPVLIVRGFDLLTVRCHGPTMQREGHKVTQAKLFDCIQCLWRN